MKIEAPSQPKKKTKKKRFSLFGKKKKNVQEEVNARTLRVRAQDKHIESNQKKTSHSNESKSAQKLRKKLGLEHKKNNIHHLYTTLEKESTKNADLLAQQYEEEQKAYEEHDDLVHVDESSSSTQIAVSYPKQKSKKEQKPSSPRKKQIIQVNVEKEGTFTSIDDSLEFKPVYHDPHSYDWSSEEGYISKKKESSKKSLKKSPKKKTSTKKSSVKKVKTNATKSSKKKTTASKKTNSSVKKPSTKTIQKKASSKKQSSKKVTIEHKKKSDAKTAKRTAKKTSPKSTKHSTKKPNNSPKKKSSKKTITKKKNTTKKSKKSSSKKKKT